MHVMSIHIWQACIYDEHACARYGGAVGSEGKREMVSSVCLWWTCVAATAVWCVAVYFWWTSVAATALSYSSYLRALSSALPPFHYFTNAYIYKLLKIYSPCPREVKRGPKALSFRCRPAFLCLLWIYLLRRNLIYQPDCTIHNLFTLCFLFLSKNSE